MEEYQGFRQARNTTGEGSARWSDKSSQCWRVWAEVQTALLSKQSDPSSLFHRFMNGTIEGNGIHSEAEAAALVQNVKFSGMRFVRRPFKIQPSFQAAKPWKA